MIAVLICVSLTSLAAGLVWRLWVVDSQVSAQHIDQLRQYESHWQPLNADTVQVDDWVGNIVLLNFWGSWCPPCVEEMPLLDQFDAQYDNLNVIGIVVDQKAAAIEFLARNDISFPSVLMNQSIVTALLDQFNNQDMVLPYSVAFDQSGQLFFTKLGPFAEAELIDLVQ